MKLLFDHNLSYRLVLLIADRYPHSSHVRTVGLQRAPDEAVWNYAREQGLIIVSKDADFHQRSLLFGSPPKVIWIGLGNCSTDEIAVLLQVRYQDVLAFTQSRETAFLALTS